MRESAFGHALAAAHGGEEAIRRIDAVEVFRNFGAEETAGDGMLRIAAHLSCPAGFVNGDKHTAGVRAVMGTDGVNGFRGHGSL
jgi:hypothetical protein